MEEIREEKINIENILQAGKSIKFAASCLLLMVFVSIAGLIFVFKSDDINTIQLTYVVLGFFNIGCSFIMIFNFYDAGNYLENIKSNKANLKRENQSKQEPITYVHFH